MKQISNKRLYIIMYSIFIPIFSLFLINTASYPTYAESTDYSVTVAPSINVTIPTDTITLDLNPESRTFASQDLNISVGTNNPTGYRLTFSSTGTSLVRDSSVDGKNATIETLPTNASGYTESNFVTNKWGYKKNGGNYFPFASGTLLAYSDTAVNSDSTNLRFASKIDYSQIAGAYSIVLNFNAVANPVPLVYMQDLDPTLCTTTPMTVLDRRDYQDYIIQKLADGNCWMMTNLNLGARNLIQDLTPQNTNLDDTITIADFESWRKTSGVYTYTEGEYIPITSANSADGSDVDPTSGTPYGTLYNYCAASAGSYCYATGSTGSAEYDICPAGWRLPTGGISDGEFKILYDQSAYNTNAKMRAPISSGGAAFALAGYFYKSAPAGQGSSGLYWSSTRFDNNDMQRLGVNTTSVNPTYHYNRRAGFAIRCVLK